LSPEESRGTRKPSKAPPPRGPGRKGQSFSESESDTWCLFKFVPRQPLAHSHGGRYEIPQDRS